MLPAGGAGETSEVIRDRVVKSRELQKRRFEGTALQCNAHMASKQIKAFCPVGPEVKELLKSAITQLGLSARAYDSILKLARTVAVLEGAESIGLAHVAESIEYRAMDRKLWG
ncbi:MAG: ATP-binding protein [Capsulimonadaceae bacterium]